jgi:hypothetical protein
MGAVPHAPVNAQGMTDPEPCLQGISPDTPFSRVPPAARRAAVACINREIAAAINAQAPLRINSDTILRSALASGMHLQYQYEIDEDGKDLTADDISRLDTITRANMCSDRLAISLGAIFTFVWIDRNGLIIHRLRIDRC